MTRIRLAWRRLISRPNPTKPMPFYTRRLPDGVLIDLEEYFEHVVTTLADDEDAFAMFMELVEDRQMTREHDGWEPERLCMERLALHVGYEVPVRGKALARLAERLRAAAPVPAIPAQSAGRTA
ncbi:hypothetical protein ACFV20_19555 [Streptomyces sp. NPDC059696]|uniref:hypothetical protein n=1 Tax=Streptomyces sp. NPDC059696 TaxID=3346911 RepID=UPI0036D01718